MAFPLTGFANADEDILAGDAANNLAVILILCSPRASFAGADVGVPLLDAANGVAVTFNLTSPLIGFACADVGVPIIDAANGAAISLIHVTFHTATIDINAMIPIDISTLDVFIFRS